MKKQDTTNTFEGGMIMDLNPLVTPNNVVTNCLNGTILTYNGNENVLQNDMGNGRVETAYLPEGYIPVGTTELGGIIYIVSYNPLIDKCQIGSFPSPERNFTGDEVSSFSKEGVEFSESDFKIINSELGEVDSIKSPIIRKQLGNTILKPGDKFIVAGKSIKNNTNISYYKDSSDKSFIPQYVDFRLATVDSNGRIVYLNDLAKYRMSDNRYTIIKEGTVESSEETDMDEYRQLISADYHIFTSKIAGSLYIVGKLETIDRISGITWELISDVEKPIIELSTDSAHTYTIRYHIETQAENGKVIQHIIHRIEGQEVKDCIFNNSDDKDSFDFTVTYKVDNKAIPEISVILIPCMPFGKLIYLQEKVNINFSLLGTSQIVNELWRYYKEENGMTIKFDLNNYYVDRKTEKVILKFDRLGTKEQAIYTMPIKKSYNGIHIINIPFGTIVKENALYRVSIESYDIKEQNISTITRYLYTNGVYNDYYLDPDRALNFDNEYLPLKLSIDFKDIKDNIELTYTNSLEEGNTFVTPVTQNRPEYIRGKTTYFSQGNIDFEPRLVLENTFEDTFGIVNSTLSAEINKIETSVNSKIIDISNSANDVRIQTSNTLTVGEKAEFSYWDRKLTYDINLISPISANTIERQVTVTDYYAPILSNVQDAYKYGLDPKIIGTNAYLELAYRTYPSFGMSGGGNDNKGGGGTFYIAGTTSIYLSEIPDEVDADASPHTELTIQGDAENDFKDTGEKGIFSFPNQYVSNVINEINPNTGIAPVLLGYVGGRAIKYGDKWYQFIGLEKTKGIRKEKFNSIQYPEFVSFLLFARIKTSEDYLPLNWIIKSVSTKTYPGSIPTEYSSSYPVFLNNIYAKRPFQDKVSIYTVNNISYVDKIVECNISISAIHNFQPDQLEFDRMNLTNLCPEENAPKCFSINPDTYSSNEEKKFNTELVLTFDIQNKYVDSYMQYQNTETIPQYVRGGIISPPDNPSISKIYIRKNNKLIESNTMELNTLSYSQDIQIKEIDNKESLEYQLYDEDKYGPAEKHFTYKNLDMFEYDSQLDILCINRDKYRKRTKWQWDGHDGVLMGDNVGIANTLFLI